MENIIMIAKEGSFTDEYLRVKSPIESIDGIWKFVRKAKKRNKCLSLPGHLLHLVIKGEYRLRTNQREYFIKEGDLIYYHACESVDWLGNEKEVIFYSVGFTAANLQPISLENRVFQASSVIKGIFSDLYEASLMRSLVATPFILFSHLTKLLAEVEKLDVKFKYSDALKNDWWEVERFFYSNQNFRPALDELCEYAHTSRSSILRLCKKATGKTPIARFQVIRMAEAKALLKSSELNVSQVSEYLAYSRVHEFSREFSNYFGKSPTRF